MSSPRSQRWDPKQYAANARFVSDLGLPVVELLSPQPGETLLDLGCGDGALTVTLVERGCRVVGIDSSPDMVTAARALGIDAQVMDGHALPFSEEFDAVFSNAALHWMNQPQQVIGSVWRALKPGGRFVGEFGGHGNVATIVVAIESVLTARGLSVSSPWFFPQPAEYRALLEAQGFRVSSLALIPRPTQLPGDILDWVETFAQPYTAALPAREKPAFNAALLEMLQSACCDASGHWTVDYVRLRFSAVKPNAE